MIDKQSNDPHTDRLIQTYTDLINNGTDIEAMTIFKQINKRIEDGEFPIAFMTAIHKQTSEKLVDAIQSDDWTQLCEFEYITSSSKQKEEQIYSYGRELTKTEAIVTRMIPDLEQWNLGFSLLRKSLDRTRSSEAEWKQVLEMVWTTANSLRIFSRSFSPKWKELFDRDQE